MTVFMFVFAEWCVVPFTMSETMLPHRGEFADVLRLYCVFMPFMGLLDTGSALLQSMRMASVSMWSSLLRNIIIVILFAALPYRPVSDVRGDGGGGGVRRPAQRMAGRARVLHQDEDEDVAGKAFRGFGLRNREKGFGGAGPLRSWTRGP